MRYPSPGVIVAAVIVAALLVLPPWTVNLRAASAFVQAFSNHSVVSAAPTVAVTGITAGNTLVICDYMQSNNRTLDSMSGGSNTYAQLQARVINTSSSTAMTVWYAYNVNSGNYTITATHSASSTYSLAVIELSGLTTTDPKDQTPAGETAEPGQTLDVGPTGTTTQANEMLVACGAASVSSRPFNAISGWTNRVALTNPYISVWTKTVSSTGAQSVTLDTTPDNQFIIGFISTFLDASAGSAPRRLMTLGVGAR